MSFYEILTLGGVMATILGIFLTLYAIINNKTLKAEARNTNELINQFRKEHHETVRIMSGNLDEFRKEHRETMRVMLENLEEFRKEHRETMRIMLENLDEFRREHRETMRVMLENLEEFRKEHRPYLDETSTLSEQQLLFAFCEASLPFAFHTCTSHNPSTCKQAD